MKMLTAARGAVPGLAPGKLNVEYVALDGTLHAVPLADAARVRLTDMQPSRRFKARKGQRNLPGRWWSATDGRHVGGRHLCAGSGSRRTPAATTTRSAAKATCRSVVPVEPCRWPAARDFLAEPQEHDR